jgi:hypothetical protein
MSLPSDWISLKSYVNKIRQEIVEAVADAEKQGAALRFDVQTIEIEVQVAATTESGGGGNGGVNLGVISFGANVAKRDISAETQKVKITLKPAVSIQISNKLTGKM